MFGISLLGATIILLDFPRGLIMFLGVLGEEGCIRKNNTHVLLLIFYLVVFLLISCISCIHPIQYLFIYNYLYYIKSMKVLKIYFTLNKIIILLFQ